LISFLREQGIFHYKVGDVELHLLLPDNPPAPAVVPEVPEAPSGTDVASEPQIRKDGLTAEQQLEIYGREMP